MTEQLKKSLMLSLKTIVDTGMASKIILFGSVAKGGDQPDSDIDLCVLTPITDKRPRNITVDLRRKLWGVKKSPLDLLTYNQERFAYHASRDRSFESIIDKGLFFMKESLDFT